MMEPERTSPQVLRFGIFELDAQAGELRRSGVKVKLQEQPLLILRALLEDPGRVLTRDELRKRIWPADTFVDFDHGLYSALARLRESLGDSADNPRFVETIPRRGYRFIAPVETPTASAAEHGSLVVVPAKSPGRLRPPVVAGMTGVACLVLVLLFGVSGYRNLALFHGRPRIRSLAVLPLENLSGDSAQEYFADGMTDQLITGLAQLQNVKVISRTSVMRYKGTKVPLPEVARELHVDGIVAGSVLLSGQHVRIDAQLLDASTDQHLWARSYERDLRDVVALQAEVAYAIVSDVNGQITPQQRARLVRSGPAKPEAFVAYLKGRYFLHNQRSAEGAAKSLQYALQAVQIDPGWAPAHAGLADSYISAGYLGALEPNEATPKAAVAAQKAVQLDPDLPEAHIALGTVAEDLTYDYEAAEREFRRAIQLSPNNSHAHQSYADLLASLGRGDEAISEIKLAQQLDPMSFWVSRDVGRIYYEARRYDEAIAALREASEMNPSSAVVYNWLSWAYDKKGMIPESVEMDLKDEANHATKPERLAELKKAFEKTGQRAYLKKKLEATLDSYASGQISARLGNYDEAFRWLQTACDHRSAFITIMKVDPELDNLRTDPRFEALLRHRNLTP